MPEQKKTLEQITQDALNSQFGLSDEDLSLLFEDDSGVTEPESDVQTSVPPSEQTVPTSSQASSVQQTPTPDVTSQSSSSGATTDVSALENALKETSEQVKQLSAIVQNLLRQGGSSQQSQTPQVNIKELEEITDEEIVRQPKEAITKLTMGLLKAVLPAAFAEYDVNTQKRMFFEAFRNQHPDFDELRPIMRQIVAEDPSKDDVVYLPQVYEEAKKRKEAWLEQIRKELVSKSEKTSIDLDDAKLALLEQKLAERIRKRKAAAGTVSADQSAPVLPKDRQTSQPKEKAITPEEQLFLDMLNSGPASSRFLKDL